MTNGTIARFAALAGVLFLAGCLGLGGEGGGADTLSEKDIERVRSDPRIAGLRSIFERADTFLVPGVYLEFAATAGGRDTRTRFAFHGTCSGTACSLRDGTASGTITHADSMTEDVVTTNDIKPTKLEVGRRFGFDTLAVEGRDRTSEKFSNETVTAAATAKSWGVWGKHGYAAVEIISGSLSGGGSFSVGMKGAWAHVFGDRNPTNPEGVGGATWQGPAEAASTRTFVRYEGKATLTIPNLAQPRIGAEIDVAGNDISELAWKDMPLSQGSFTAGTAGRDYLAGNFHGPQHEEAYGVFDTGAYVGAFGATRR